MSKFYGTVMGSANTPATRRGSRSIKVAAQSWSGSVVTRLHYNEKDELIIDLQLSDGSDTSGYTVFYGTMDQLRNKLQQREETA